jgi:RecA-family ATPase
MIIERYDLREGPKGEWHGPCPHCGYNDTPSTRFWISERDGLVKVHCRQCEDFKAIIKALAADGVWPDLGPIKSNVVKINPFASDANGAAIAVAPPAPPDPAPDPFEPYYQRKGVELLGARLDGLDVVIPLFNTARDRVGWQRITPDGTKRFNPGLSKDGGVFGVVGKGLTRGGAIWVAEGWATACSVHMATARPVIFALDAGNMPAVCNAIEAEWPEARLRIAADNDEKGLAAARATGKPYAVPALPGADWNDVHAAAGMSAVKAGLAEHRLIQVKRLFTHLDDLVIRQPEWLIDGLIEVSTLAMCFGSAGSGKSFAVLDMALCIASGTPYHGHEVQQGSVFYIAGEGLSGMSRRAAAWQKHHSVGKGQAQFYLSNRAVIMSDPSAVDVLKSEIAALVEVAGKPRLLVIDTLARSLGGASENDGKDVNEFIVACDSIKEEYGCTVMLVHHSGHQSKERARGASQINAALDHEFRIDAVGDNLVTLTFTKQKEDAMPEPKAFVKLPIEMMTADMEHVSSIVLEFTADMPGGFEDDGLNKEQRNILATFDEVQEHGEADRDQLRDAHINKFGAGNRDSDRRKFNINIRALLEKQDLRQSNGIISKNDHD